MNDNRWYCFLCRTFLGPKKVTRCPHCGSQEVDNIA